MRGIKARKLRKIALNYSIVHANTVGPGKLMNTRHKNTLGSRLSFLKYGGYPRVYRDMKKSYREGTFRI